MKRINTLSILTGLAVLSCSLIFSGCVNPEKDAAAAADTEQVVVTAADEKVQMPVEQRASEAPLYMEIPRNLNPVECGGCHYRDSTKENGILQPEPDLSCL